MLKALFRPKAGNKKATKLSFGSSRRAQRYRRRAVRVALLTANFAVLVLVTLFVTRGSGQGQNQNLQSALPATNAQEEVTNPLDQLSTADIAVHIARMANLPEARAVVNKADTVNTELSLSSTDQTIVAKPQIADTAAKSSKDIKRYTVLQGDTVPSLAVKFGITSDSIRWSNNLGNDTLTPGSKLLIPPINGIVYTVKAGETPDSLAAKFKANKDFIVEANDAETTGLKANQVVLIPDGSISAFSRPVFGGTVASFSSAGFSATYGSGGYDRGYCTWWADYRRAQVGKPIPSNLGNASTWKSRSQAAGIPVGNTPQQYAVWWVPPRDYYGHVGFVEIVNADGSIWISEMNSHGQVSPTNGAPAGGWNRVDYRLIPADQVRNYSYIY